MKFLVTEGVLVQKLPEKKGNNDIPDSNVEADILCSTLVNIKDKKLEDPITELTNFLEIGMMGD